MGIKELGCPYFERDAEHKQRFIRCWPSILKWLKVILDTDIRQFYEEENICFAVASEAINICLSVHQGALDTDEVLELAVRIWIGHKGLDGTDHFAAGPMLACLPRRTPGSSSRTVEQIMHACGIDAEQMTNKIIRRLKYATRRSALKDVGMVISLSTLMWDLVGLREKSITLAIFSPSAGCALVSVTRDILNDPRPSIDSYSRRTLLTQCHLRLPSIQTY